MKNRFFRKLTASVVAAASLWVFTGCQIDNRATPTATESSTMQWINFSGTSVQAIRIMSLFLWEQGLIDATEKVLLKLRDKGNVNQKELVDNLIKDGALKQSFWKHATLLFNFSLLLGGSIEMAKAIDIIVDAKEPVLPAQKLEKTAASFLKGIGMFCGGALGIFFWAAQNPKDPTAKKILSGLFKVSRKALDRLLFYTEWPVDHPNASYFQKAKSRLPHFFAAVPAKLYDSITGMKEISWGIDQLKSAANANGDLLAMSDDMFKGIMYIGNGVSRIWNSVIPGYLLNLPMALFSVAIFVRNQDGFADTYVMKALRAPIDAQYKEAGEMSAIRDNRENIYTQWHKLWADGYQNIPYENLRQSIVRGLSMAEKGEVILPFSPFLETYKMVTNPKLTKEEQLKLLSDPMKLKRFQMMKMVYFKH